MNFPPNIARKYWSYIIFNLLNLNLLFLVGNVLYEVDLTKQVYTPVIFNGFPVMKPIIFNTLFAMHFRKISAQKIMCHKSLF